MCCLVIAPLHCLSFVRDCLRAGSPPSQFRFPNQLLKEGELFSSPVLRTTVKKALEMILPVVAYLGLCWFLIVGTLVCFPIACLTFSKKKHAAVFDIAGDIAIYS